MMLWRSDRFRKYFKGDSLWPQTVRAERVGAICPARLNRCLKMPQGLADVWLELHDRKAPDRLKLTVTDDRSGEYQACLEGVPWGWLWGGKERLLRRLGLIGGKRDCLWLEVWYREV